MLTLFSAAMLSVLAAYLATSAATPSRPLSERLLISAVTLTLGIQFEALTLSALPVEHPLTAWPTVHMTVCFLLVLAAFRQLGRRGSGEALSQLVRWPRLLHARIGWLGDLVVLALVVAFAGCLLWGLVSAPNGVDELGYHVPQAAEIYQNRSLGRPTNFLPWTYAYPQGAAILWAWTIYFVHGDQGIHLVQAGFGLELLLAVYVLAKRAGATSRLALAGALAVGAAPVFFRMSTIATADMCFTAGTIAMLAFLAPGQTDQSGADWRLGILGFSQACGAKIPFVALALGLPAAAWLSVLHYRALRPARSGLDNPPWHWRRLWRWRWLDALAVAALGGSLSTYVVNLMHYGNPFWPLQLAAGVHTFPGPLRAFTDHTIGAHTTWGSTATLSRAELWAASFFNWSQPLNEDSLGAFGPDIAILGLASAGLAIWKAARARAGWLLAIAAASAIAMAFVPVLFVPRYGLPVVAVLVALGATAWSGGPARLVVLATVVLCAYSATPSFRFALDGAAWYRANAPGRAWWQDRGHSVAEKYRLNDPRTAQSPGVVRYVRTHVREGDLLVWNVMGYPTLMWNLAFSNRIEYLPGSSREAYPTGASRDLTPTPGELNHWLTRLNRLHPQYVVLYQGSIYEKTLLSTGLWTRDYTDPPSEGSNALSVLRPVVARPAARAMPPPATRSELH